MEIGAGRSKGA